MYLCSCLQAIVMSPLNPSRLAGGETGLPPRFRGGLGWGNFMGNSFITFKQFHSHTNSRVYISVKEAQKFHPIYLDILDHNVVLVGMEFLQKLNEQANKLFRKGLIEEHYLNGKKYWRIANGSQITERLSLRSGKTYSSASILFLNCNYSAH